MKNKSFCSSLTRFSRRKSSEVAVGSVVIGGEYPIVVQSMCTTSTMDTDSSVAQARRIAEKGGQIVRYTAQGVSEAENLKNIREELNRQGCTVPLVADIHFNPRAAVVAAGYVEKVRINPGNFVDKRAVFEKTDYTDEQWNSEKERLKVKFYEFLDVCEQYGTAVRIGVNHGSLSDRIMSRYGDTPEGMVASAIEFLELCEQRGFYKVVVSMKSSNTRVMVRAYRMLAAEMSERGMKFPLHLGVTEAGEGNDGRIRSAVGIGALLSDGLGDTIRVSLTEEPENEIPVARALADYFDGREKCDEIDDFDAVNYNPYEPSARPTVSVNGFGGDNSPLVVVDGDVSENYYLQPDYIYNDPDEFFVKFKYKDLKEQLLSSFADMVNRVLVLEVESPHFLAEVRATAMTLWSAGVTLPLIVSKTYSDTSLEMFQLKSAADYGAVFIDMLCEGLWLRSSGGISCDNITDTSFSILQSSRARVSKTEYISCPGCGRTLYSLQETLREIKAATADFKGIKIAVMGCIVNGPGEMADADYGFVGQGVGLVTLYKGKEVIKRNIKQSVAVNELVDFIKQDRGW